MSGESTHGYGVEYSVNPNIPVLDSEPARLLVTRWAPGLVGEMDSIDRFTSEHQLGTAQLAIEIARSSLPDTVRYRGHILDTVTLVGVSAGLHDTGKSAPDVQGWIHQPIKFTPERRQWIQERHCSGGAERIKQYAHEQQLVLLGLARPGIQALSSIQDLDPGMDTVKLLVLLECAAFGAQHHHSLVPEHYAALPPDGALLWGLTHLLKYCDVLHALWYDHSRMYQGKREEELSGPRVDRSPDDVLKIMYRECGFRNPVIAGVEIDMWPEIRRRLGLAA